MLRDPGLEEDLRRGVEARRLRFTEQRFMSEILAVIDSFDGSTSRDTTMPDNTSGTRPAVQLRQV
ncbi:MAG TPA: hypothetical protein VMT89_01290, partial [Candidatus Acidoferrales bacterium]|nr:hypothetical protein [Candidatus Acidoferrales bacterium]